MSPGCTDKKYTTLEGRTSCQLVYSIKEGHGKIGKREKTDFL
jgi:hypothetical protein